MHDFDRSDTIRISTTIGTTLSKQDKPLNISTKSPSVQHHRFHRYSLTNDECLQRLRQLPARVRYTGKTVFGGKWYAIEAEIEAREILAKGIEKQMRTEGRNPFGNDLVAQRGEEAEARVREEWAERGLEAPQREISYAKALVGAGRVKMPPGDINDPFASIREQAANDLVGHQRAKRERLREIGRVYRADDHFDDDDLFERQRVLQLAKEFGNDD